MTTHEAWYETDEPSLVRELCDREARRQQDNLILIPSESMCIAPAADLLGSAFGNIYAEGYPQPILDHVPRHSAADAARFASWQTRLSDRRFYKGCLNADRVELLAHRYIAEAFARLEGSPDVDDIHVNVQALSGAAANNAVYEALLEPGDTIMGMKLSHGGHLTHGSQFNLSGKRYNVVSYGVHPKSERLDYVDLMLQAREHRPRLIIGGASAYPWDIEWNHLREIADDVGALLLADVAHLAGMIVGGVLNNPLAYADVVTGTTHKTLCGPRGALILTASPDIARTIDAAVFPGTQGGPHVNAIAGIARLFELINQRYDAYAAFQAQIVRNTVTLAQALVQQGFKLAYDGTNTHMLLVDLRPLETPGETDVPLDGEIASRLLELAGIVVNKNTIPGDEVAGESSGIRMGMPWATQRGITPQQIETLAEIVLLVLTAVHTTRVWVPGNVQRCRGRIDPRVLHQARDRTRGIIAELTHRPPEPETPVLNVDLHDTACLIVRGDKTRAALQQVLTCNIADLMPEDDPQLGLLLDGQAGVLAKACVFALPDEGREQRYAIVTQAETAQAVMTWLEDLSDGYVLIDPDDLHAKIDGPLVVEDVSTSDLAGLLIDAARDHMVLLPDCSPDGQTVVDLDVDAGSLIIDPTKTFFIGQSALLTAAREDDRLAWLLREPDPPNRPYSYEPAHLPLRKTVLNERHRDLGAKMVEFAGWEMPVHYEPGIFAEHRAVRTAAGLFDVSHMGVFEISGRHATAFLDTVLAGCVTRLDVGMAGYNYLLYPDGRAMDDVYIYRLERQRYLLVVNAANAEEDRAWLDAVNDRATVIDDSLPGGRLKRVDGSVALRNLRDAGADSLVDLAFQGPRSLDVLMQLAPETQHDALRRLAMNQFLTVTLVGSKGIVARTGYTGEPLGYELFVHPDKAVELFDKVLEAGRDLGVLPCGLGARDSLRTEAGFPLFGHELEGELGGTLTECDYGFIPRFHVPFFIGRSAYIERVTPRRRKTARLAGSGRKSLRVGHQILDDEGRAVGVVTSFAFLNDAYDFVVLAGVDVEIDLTPGRPIRGLRASSPPEPDAALPASKLVDLTVMTRFPTQEEREGWAERYRKA